MTNSNVDRMKNADLSEKMDNYENAKKIVHYRDAN